MSQKVERPWRLYPHTFANHLSKGKWVPFNYLIFLSHLIAALVAKGDGRLLVSLPPRHGKSLFISQWVPAWFLEWFPDQPVILTTYEATFAARWGRKVRETLLLNEHELDVRLHPDVAAANRWATTEGGGMITAGIGGPITGEGGKLLLIDDPHKNWQEAMSAHMRDGIIDWYKSTFYTRCEPGATIIVLHTRWHEKDLIGYLSGEEEIDGEKWIVVNLPALAESPKDVLERKFGQALCPERYNEKALNRIRHKLGEMIWAGLYQQRPMMDAGNVFKEHWWMRFGKAPSFMMTFQSWDTALKKGETNAFSSCTTWGVGATGFFMLDLFRERLEFPGLKREAVRQFNKWKPTAVLIEDKASGTSLLQVLKEETTIPVIAIEPTADKLIRAMEVSPIVEGGRAWLPEKAPWVAEFIQNAKTFPNIEFLDDIDSMTQFLRYAKQFTGTHEMLRAVPRRTPRLMEGFRE